MADRIERNKSNAQRFYALMFNDCRPREAIEQYAGDVYIQHNPHVGDGKEAFVAYFEKMAREYPGKQVLSLPPGRRTPQAAQPICASFQESARPSTSQPCAPCRAGATTRCGSMDDRCRHHRRLRSTSGCSPAPIGT